MQPLGEQAKVVGDALFMVRGARNPVQLAEDAENTVGVALFCQYFLNLFVSILIQRFRGACFLAVVPRRQPQRHGNCLEYGE
jgi:hypothetical protein